MDSKEHTTEKKKILIIEDDDLLGNVLITKLSSSGYDVSLERDGEAGLAAVSSYKPDLILLDIVLPHLNGYEVMERLYEDKVTEHTPVIIISNSGQPVEISRTLALGASDYLVKANFTPDEVLKKVEEQLSRHAAVQCSLTDRKILLIEDDPFLSDLLGVKLKKENCELYHARDGHEALKLAGEHQPSVILLDLVLPSMHGFEVLEKLKGDPKTADIPVIILSNLSQESDKVKGMELGAHDFLVKSNFNTSEIIEKIKKLI